MWISCSHWGLFWREFELIPIIGREFDHADK